ncbi:hypothetical protein Hanom_Chr07g00606321 [Helianthus anomalus]
MLSRHSKCHPGCIRSVCYINYSVVWFESILIRRNSRVSSVTSLHVTIIEEQKDTI